MKLQKYEVAADKLRRHCDPDQFEFDSTENLDPLQEFIGQERAIRAIEFGLYMDKPQYNIYVAGVSGTGKTSAVKRHIEKIITEREAKGESPSPNDWCYLYNFKDVDYPQIASLPQGKGRIFRDQVAILLEGLKYELKRAFSSEEYTTHVKRVVEEGQSEQQRLFEQVGQEAREQGFLLEATPTGPVLIPLAEGKPMAQADYLSLDDSVKKEYEAKRLVLLQKLQATLEKAQEVEREKIDKVREVDNKVGEITTSRLLDKLIEEYEESEITTRYLKDLKSYTLENLNLFKGQDETAQAMPGLLSNPLLPERDPFLCFKVNVFVDNSDTKGPPVIVEANPNYANVFGRIERRFLLGGYLTDHTMVKPGAINLANGGYLLMNARDVLTNPGVWPALKRAIRNGEARIEDPVEQFGLIAPQGMRPEPIPVDVKVVLTGDGWLYQMLSMYDEDFWEIFKVKADFDFQVERNEENINYYAAFISACCRDHMTRHFDRSGVAKVIEHAARMVADQEKLSSRFAQIRELIEEADYWANKNGSNLVTATDVDRAIKERMFRHNLVDQHMKDMINQGTVMIDTQGAVVGQVNGLSVYSLGDITFGKPSRITAKTFMGRSGITNIERESQLSGKIHDKGVLILGGYLGWKYAQDRPLSLSASLCFEQSYDGIDGDSASSTELYAIISSLSGVPIKQNIAVTGSVNQKGEIQPIGGVNHKIEGFFDICNSKRLTGDQGVLIPYQNLRNLMLREDVIESVHNKQFHIYAVTSIDEGIEVLTGMKAGEKEDDGTYPEDTINFLVEKQLKEMSERLRSLSRPDEKDHKDNNENEEHE